MLLLKFNIFKYILPNLFMLMTFIFIFHVHSNFVYNFLLCSLSPFHVLYMKFGKCSNYHPNLFNDYELELWLWRIIG